MWTFADLIRNFFTHKDFLPGADKLPGTLFTPLHFAASACWITLIVLTCVFLRKKKERTIKGVFAVLWATLAVTESTVDHTEFRFELDYTGLPYNADGTSAVFHIVGVTDAGDEAIMGWRATSGTGYVSGTFIGLEPLTDYTATFEVYYNGKPTGVTASVSFTSGEGIAVNGYDRDSFLLGFASGLGCTAATKDGAEYNSWAQGYIVGSELRKALVYTVADDDPVGAMQSADGYTLQDMDGVYLIQKEDE
jgi:hypothetical protein